MVVNFIILKFMHYWSAKGDVAFKLGIISMLSIFRTAYYRFEQETLICIYPTISQRLSQRRIHTKFIVTPADHSRQHLLKPQTHRPNQDHGPESPHDHGFHFQ